MSRQSKPMSLRDREIREILDEDRKYYRQVLEREFKQSRLMNETYAPPNLQEKQVAFQIDRYFLRLQEESDKLLNGLVAGTPEDAQDLFSAYQELIIYLQTYAKYGTLGQRDLAVIENKFDAIAPQIEQIATASASRRLKDASLLQQLASILDNKHYVLLRGASVSIPEVSNLQRERQRVERQRERTLPPTYSDSDIEPKPLAQLFRQASARERTPFLEASPSVSESEGSYQRLPSGTEAVQTESEAETGRPQWSSPLQFEGEGPQTLREAKEYLSTLSEPEYKILKNELGISTPRSTLSKKTILRIWRLRERNMMTMDDAVQREAEADLPPVIPEDNEEMIEYGNEGAEGPQPEMEGDGRRRSHGMKIGAGEAEDMMFGRPAGVKKAMFLRPMDRRPVHFKTADQRKEVGLSLEDRMSFLNQLESKPVKDELKINSIHTYKKAMSEKAKQLEKMKK